MSTLKSIAQWFADKFLTKEDLLPGLLEQMSQQEVATFIRTKLSKEIPSGYDRYSKAYKDALAGAENMLVAHHSVDGMGHLSRVLVRETSPQSFFTRTLIDKILQEHIAEADGSTTGDNVAVQLLLEKVADARKEAEAEKNYVKKRAVVRKAVTAAYPKLGTDRTGLVTELVLSL